MLSIGLLQMTSHGPDREANLAKGEDFCRRAAELGADLALFPEMWSNGYTLPADEVERPGWVDQAIDVGDPFVQHFQALAVELNMAIALTFLERWPGAPRNSVAVIDNQGEIRMVYAKVHTCDFDIERAVTPGDDFHVCELDTAAGRVKVGAMICYDRDYPESARILMLKGAEIILTPNACMLDQLNIDTFRVRAYENVVGVAMTNYAAPKNNGHSCAFDPIAHPEENGPLRNTLVVEAGETEGVFVARFELDAIRAFRERETLGDAFRKPGRYALLAEDAVKPPFVRAQARR